MIDREHKSHIITRKKRGDRYRSHGLGDVGPRLDELFFSSRPGVDEIPEGATARPVHHSDVMSGFEGELVGQFQACLKLDQSVTSCLCLSLHGSSFTHVLQ